MLPPEPPLVGLVPPPLLRRIDEWLEDAALLGTLFLFLGAGICFGYLLFHRDLLPAYGWLFAPATLLPAAIGWRVAHRLRAVEAGSTEWGARLLASHVQMRAAHWVIAVSALFAIGVVVGGVAV